MTLRTMMLKLSFMSKPYGAEKSAPFLYLDAYGNYNLTGGILWAKVAWTL